MSVSALDAMALAIFHFEGGSHPTSRNVRNCNPGNLRPWKSEQPHDADNYRTFPLFSYGWQELRLDLLAKTYRMQLQPLAALFEVYAPGADHNDPKGYAQFVCNWMTQALDRPITIATLIKDIGA